MRLRDYERDGVDKIESAWKTCRRVLYALPTGGGKTVVASTVVKRARRSGGRVLWLAHRRELVNQAVKSLVDADVSQDDIGVVMGTDSRARSSAPFQVGSIDTVRRRDVDQADYVVVDEAHHAPAKSWRGVIDEQTSAKVLGLSATPYRLDGRGLEDVFDHLVCGPSPKALIEAGWLARPKVFAPEDGLLPNLAGLRTIAGDFEQSELSLRSNRREIVGGIVEHWARLSDGRRTVAFAVDVAHATSIAKAFTEVGVRAEVLTGDTKSIERDAILRRLALGETQVVANCQVLTEGWDAPSVKCAILARPTKSESLYVQTTGRLLRPWEGVTPLVLDHAGNAYLHRLPHSDRVFSLRGSRKHHHCANRYLTKENRLCDRTDSGELIEAPGTLVELPEKGVRLGAIWHLAQKIGARRGWATKVGEILESSGRVI